MRGLKSGNPTFYRKKRPTFFAPLTIRSDSKTRTKALGLYIIPSFGLEIEIKVNRIGLTYVKIYLI
jgi:hypothetical protein